MSPPDPDHVLRHVSSTKKEDDGSPGVDAFFQREGEKGISCNWVEYFKAQDISKVLPQVEVALQKKKYTVGPNAIFAVLNVGEIKQAAQLELGRELSVEQDSILAIDPSHSLILGAEGENDLDFALNLKEQVRDHYPSFSFPCTLNPP